MGVSYFSRPLGPGHILDVIKAPSVRILRERMLKNNLKHKGFVVYQDIAQSPVDKLWYAWFYAGADLFESLNSLKGSDG
jgi:hypothetical protein